VIASPSPSPGAEALSWDHLSQSPGDHGRR
jgi:hypothetical protein